MCALWKRWLGFAMASAIFLAPLGARATAFNVTIDSSGLSGSKAILAFDFVDGGLPNNSVTLSIHTSDGTQGPPSVTGDIKAKK